MHLSDWPVATSQFHQPTCFWKWVGGTNPFKSGILSSEADPEKNIHCSWQDGHIIGTGNTWIFRKCLRIFFLLTTFATILDRLSSSNLITLLLQFDHWSSLDLLDFFSYFSSYLQQMAVFRTTYHVLHPIWFKFQHTSPPGSKSGKFTD